MISATLAVLAALGAAPETQAPLTAPDPARDEVLVYIYRSNGYARASDFLVDDTRVASLFAKECTVFKATAGHRRLTQKWWNAGILENRPLIPLPFERRHKKGDHDVFQIIDKPVEWMPGRTYYYRFESFGAINVNGPTEITYDLNEVSAQTAAGPIHTCGYKAPVNLDKINGGAPRP